MNAYTVQLIDRDDRVVEERTVLAESADAANGRVANQLDKDWAKRGVHACKCGRDRHTYECRTVWALRAAAEIG